ncbi:hypothetical protein Q2T94_07475 [Paeniglutamicibacter sulfureus]|uniref:hypothetical protein n=1 Tax=Paeniglutamicibacter sulfureus TaxID=43666 RepID=UPI00266693B6|nr:hypothetical protein [Paeniglutamicibacter sulfureus]MDO2934135.1 hypothetical protein [Paeniglutamicibacter sulfureus]
MWGRKNKEKSVELERAYIRRLQEIEESNQSADMRGPTPENLRRGQAEYLGEVTSGDYSGYLVVVDSMGMLTQDPARTESDLWLSCADLSVGIEEYWVAIIRRNERQKPVPFEEDEFYYRTLPELLDAMAPMHIRWYSATETNHFFSEPNDSPDWDPE